MRSMAKVLIAASCLVLATGAFAGMLGDLYEIPKTTVAPVIDGVMDPVWHNVGQVFQRTYTNGTAAPDDVSDLMGWSRLMYDDNNMYVLLYTQDDVIQDVHANTYERDSWEIYFDGDNSKTEGAYDNVNDLQIRLGHGVVDVADLEGQSYWVKDGVEYAVLDNPAEAPSGWLTEVKFPLAGIFVEPVAGSIIGFELQQNDNDGTARESVSKWWVAEGDPSWNNASTFGEAVLTAREIKEELQVPKTDAAPVIDGIFDADLWESKAVPFQINSFDNAGTPGNWPDSYEDDFGRMWAMWDNDNFYMFLEAWDDIIQDVHANTYERDCFEVYFDGDNSKAEAYDTVNDMQLRFGHWAAADTDIDGGGVFATAAPGIEFVNLDTDLGWNLEVKFPLANIQLENVVGSTFGFEVQQGDNDGTAREAVTKWWTEVGDPSWNNASGWGTAELTLGTAVEENAPVARNFGLAQNYPNPFNPTTTVPYSLKSAGKVRLSVFDMMGREVAVLADGIMPAGSHTAQFTANNLSSGIYFCKLQTADNVMTTKMTLVK